jgi:hypothetical protein
MSATTTVSRSSNVLRTVDEPYRKMNGKMNDRTGHNGIPDAALAGVHLTLVR